MTRRPLLVAVLSAASVVFAIPASAAEPAVVADGLSFPAGIAFDSSGTMYVSERAGRLLAFGPDGQRSVVGSVPTITQGETGLLGISVSSDQSYVYAFATERDGTNTIWRFPARGGEPERVITDLPGGTYHNGGGVAFGSDGMLYVSNGEAHTTSIAQDPDVLGGKIYRFAPDGEIPEDNPFGDSPAFSIGHRNPFGLAIDPVSGLPFVTENGPESHDEINRIVAGGNGGWPVTSGPAGSTDVEALVGRYQDPILDYPDVIVPTGIAFAPPGDDGGRFAGDLFFGAYADQSIHRVSLNEARSQATSDEIFYAGREPIVALAWGPRGLYFSTPDSVQVFAVRGSGGEPKHDGASSAPPSDRRPAPDGAPARWIPFVLFGAAGLVLATALVYAFGPKRRGRA